MFKLLAIATGGALGTLLRYGMQGFVYRFLDATFPWGTLSVNLTGSLVIGVLAGFFESAIVAPALRSFVMIGILGGFTTFSSFTLETFNLVRDGEVKLAVINMVVSNVLGLALVAAGYFLFKLIGGRV